MCICVHKYELYVTIFYLEKSERFYTYLIGFNFKSIFVKYTINSIEV